MLGYYLAGEDWTKVFDIDTENNSVNLFAGIDSSAGVPFGKFKHGKFTPDLKYKPSNYEAFKEAALAAGAEVVINDSISHAWSYEGGILDRLAELKKSNKRYQNDSYAAWGDEEIVSRHVAVIYGCGKEEHPSAVAEVLGILALMENEGEEVGKDKSASQGPKADITHHQFGVIVIEGRPEVREAQIKSSGQDPKKD